MAASPHANDDDTDSLLDAVARGDVVAMRALLEKHRERLRRMVDLRLDARVASRLDASDVVQETLMDASRKMADYGRDQPLPFYPWLHRLAAERVAHAHRMHLRAGGRSVAREQADAFVWSADSAVMLVDRFVVGDTTPGHALVREERRQQVHAGLERLAHADREVLVMRYLEDLNFPEIAAILGIGESAAKMRHLRALQRIRLVIESDDPLAAP